MLSGKIIIFFQSILPLLIAIFVVVLISILLIRVIARILLHFAKKKYQKIIKRIKYRKNVKAEKVLPKADKGLFIKKELPRSLVEKLPSNVEEQENQEIEEVKIVDIVKPVGFWTSMVLGQTLTYLVSSAKIMNKNSKKGFWISMVEAQERAQGRQKGRSL
jgi:hypothetical protein